MKEIKIYEIPNIDFIERIDDPYIGMIFYVADIDTYYSVKTLKEINGINMKGSKLVEYVIDEYAAFGTGSGGGSGLTPTQLSNIAKIPAIQSTVDALPNNYASKNHNHSEYASSSHRHDASEIDNLPSGGGGSGEGLTSTQKQQLQTAYEHSQSTHVTSNDLSNIDAVSLNGKTISEPLSKVQYDAIVNKDANTIYLVEDDNAIIGVPDYSLADANKILALNNKGTQLIWKEAGSLDSITSPNGTKFRLVVDDAGNLSTVRVVEYGNIIIDPISCNVTEGGRVTFTVKLDKAPSTNQTITINTDSVYLVPSPSTITFNSANYNELQTITLTSSADDNEVDDIVLVTLSCAGIDSETLTVNVKEVNSYNAPTNPIPASDISLFSNCIDTTNFIFEATDTSVWDALSIGKITVPNNEAQHYKLHFTLLDKNFIDTETETFKTVLVYIISAVDTSHSHILIDGGTDSTPTTGDRYADKITAYIKEGRLHEELISEPFYIKSENVEAALTTDKIFGMQFKNTNTGNYLKAQIYIEKL